MHLGWNELSSAHVGRWLPELAYMRIIECQIATYKIPFAKYAKGILIDKIYIIVLL